MVGTSLDPLDPPDSAVKCVNAHPVFWPETGLFGFACCVLYCLDRVIAGPARHERRAWRCRGKSRERTAARCYGRAP